MPRYFTKEVLPDEKEIVSAIKQWAYPLGSKAIYNHYFERIGDAQVVMLGEEPW